MEYLRNLKLNTDKLAVMKLRVEKYQKLINWRNNAVCNSVNDLSQAAKMDLDCGLENTIKLMPTNGFHSWVAYCFAHTRLYNRDRPAGAPRMLCIIRTVLQTSAIA